MLGYGDDHNASMVPFTLEDVQVVLDTDPDEASPDDFYMLKEAYKLLRDQLGSRPKKTIVTMPLTELMIAQDEIIALSKAYQQELHDADASGCPSVRWQY